MSGILLTAEPMPIAAPKDTFAALVPVVPTTRREFDRLTVSARSFACIRDHERPRPDRRPRGRRR